MQFLAKRFHVRPRLEPRQRPHPGPVRFGYPGMHHGWHENIGDSSGLRAGEGRWSHTNNLVQAIAHPKRASDDRRILRETALPIIVRDHGVRMRSRFEIVVLGKQPAYGGPQSERFKHPAGDILQVRLLHFLIGPVSQVLPLCFGDSQQLGLAFDGGAHQAERRIRPVVAPANLTVESTPSRHIAYSRSGSATGSGRSSSASISRKADVQAPIARASDRIAAADVTFFFRSCRQPNTASARKRLQPCRQSYVAACFAIAQRRAKGAPGLDWVAPLLDRFGDVRLQLFVDLAAHTVAAKYIRHPR